MDNSKKGFTLAEVLITLLIIGVVASLVIPGLISDTQDAELRTEWKKTYSSINQAYKEILMDNGGTLAGAINNSGGGFNSNFRNLFKNKMRYVAICDDSSCAANSIKRLDGSPDVYSFNGYNLVLTDGTILSNFQLDSASCNAPFSYTYGKGECGWFLVDVNGKKGPNQWGKDVYGIWVMYNQLLPWGANPVGKSTGGYIESTCNTSGSGYGCGSKYLHN